MLSNEQFERQNFLALIHKIQQSSIQLLGDHPARYEILSLCEDYELRGENTENARDIQLPLIAILGLKGQGKSWCARALVLDENVRTRLPSGVLSREATTKLYWIGETPPSKLNSEHEVFLHVDNSLMLDLGMKYVLLDTPGSTDANEIASKIAASATSIAPVVVLVSRLDQMRSAALATLAHRAEGSIVVPVITATNAEQLITPVTADGSELEVTAQTKEQTQRWIKNMQQSAIQSVWLEPLFIEDFEETGRESDAINRLQIGLRSRLAGVNAQAIVRSRETRLNALTKQLKEDVSSVLVGEVPHLASAVVELNRHAEQIPEQAIEAIMGSKSQLLVAVRSQLRTQWVADTPALFFPYRTVMSILAMTHGAWDRVVLALSGSLPSLFGSMTAWTKNFEIGRKFQTEVKDGLQERIESQIRLLLQPIHERFRHSLRTIRSSSPSALDAVETTTTMRLSGIEQLQMRSSEIFAQTLEKERISSAISIITGLIGTLLFWALFAGPIVGIYRDYIAASWHALTTSDKTVLDFPAPSASLLFTAVILSILPVAIFCMFVLTCFLRRRRVARVCDKIATEHRSMVQQLRNQGLLKLEMIDDELRNARFLVSLENESSNR